jgi:hypothetical protein
VIKVISDALVTLTSFIQSIFLLEKCLLCVKHSDSVCYYSDISLSEPTKTAQSKPECMFQVKIMQEIERRTF